MFYISKELKDALNIFNLNIPFVEADLKKSFRRLVMETHPDVTNGDQKLEEKYKKILDAYKILKENVCDEINLDISSDLLMMWAEEEKDITNIYDPCPTCKGTKYEQHIISVRVNCPNCDGSGMVELKCKYCDNGTFTTRRGFKVPCKSCGGTGIWKKVPCKVCNPSSYRGYSYLSRLMRMFDIGITYEDKIVNKICSNCHGRGKIKLDLYNPVIKKGAILS